VIDMNNLTTVFLFTHIGIFQSFIIFGAIILYFVLFGFLWANLLVNLKQKPYLNGRIFLRSYSFSKTSYIGILVYAMVFLPIFMFFFSTGFGTSYFIVFRDEYSKLQERYDSQQYFIAEGVVHVLHTQNRLGHDQGDIIRVGNTEFEIDAWGGGWNYSKTISHGGALTEGTYAKIFYVENPIGNSLKYLILRIDIRK
jgi:hypothetical protein